MAILPSGTEVGISSDRARFHAAEFGLRVKASTPVSRLYGLIDILISHPRDSVADIKGYGFSGYTLADTHWIGKWEAADRRFFRDWIRQPAQVQVIELARRRVLAEDSKPKQRVYDYPERLYGGLRARIAALNVSRASAAQWRSTVLNLKQKGVRREELDWSGVLEFLEKQPTDLMIDKAVVVEAIDYSVVRPRLSNELMCEQSCRLPFEEVAQKMAGYQLQWAGCPVADNDIGVVRLTSDSPSYRIGVVWPQGRALLGNRPLQWFALSPMGQAIPHADDANLTLFDSREAALQAANRNALRNGRAQCDLTERARYDYMSLHGGEAYREWLITLPHFPRSHFSGHFAERNILAHIRTKVRTTTDGARVLFIEELQSDWHQSSSRSGSGAPYHKEWATLALKLMLIHAVESGLDGLAWADADVHEMRYDRPMAPLRRLYDQHMPDIATALGKPWGLAVEQADFVTRSPWLHAVQAKQGWKVEGGSGKFLTRPRYNKSEAAAVIDRHSKTVTLTLPLLRISDQMRADITHSGLPLFGTKTTHKGS